MPRSSDGSFSLPNGTLVNTGDTILVSQHNPALTDIAQAVSNSLDRDGKGGMRADLNMGGNKLTNLAAGVNPTDAATVGQIAGGTTVPIGAVIDYWGATPPSGFLFAAGQAVSRSTYAALFAIIGTAAGAGDGSTTFNLPDYRGRVSAGREAMATPGTTRLDTLASSTLGATGGAQTHTLTTAELASHTHAVTDPTHSHSGSSLSVDSGTRIASSTSSSLYIQSSTTSNSATGITVANAGGGGAHNNVQPTIICNKIMRVS